MLLLIFNIFTSKFIKAQTDEGNSIIIFSLFFIISCQEHKETPISATEEENGLQETVDSLSKATAIFWIDKYHMKEMKKDDALSFRTAKAKVIIRTDGTIALQSFVEVQPANAQRYIRYRLKDFKVKKILMDNRYINPGEQYVQLRYIPALAKRVK